MKFRKKPVIVNARRWEGGDYSWLSLFCGKNWGRAEAVGYDQETDDEQVVVFNTASQAWLHIPVGQWIVRGTHGELYPCEDTIFAETYEAVE